MPPLTSGGGPTPPASQGLKSGSCTEGQSAPCSLTLSEHDGVLSCYHGTQRCTGGVWSGCTDGEISYQAGIGIDRTSGTGPQSRLQALSTPTDCLTNPCDPTCQVFDEVPDGGIVAEAGVRWPWTGGTLSGVGTPNPGLQEPCQTGNDCQFNTFCSNAATGPACSHDKCSTGAALRGNCDSCVSDVCAQDSSCCTGCGPGEILSPDGNSCYYIGTTTTDWDSARAACQSRGTGWDLASFATGAEDEFVASLANDLVWIGLNDLTTQFTWQWANGEAVSYTNWASGQPDNNGGNERCVRMINLSGSTGSQWHDWPCSTLSEYACEGPSQLANTCSHSLCTVGGALSSSCDSCAASICSARPSCCSTAWDSTCAGMVKTTCGRTCACAADEIQSSDGLSCYYRITTQQSWTNSRTMCAARGTGWGLAKIDSAGETKDIAAIRSSAGANLWMGLNDRATEGTFVWSSDGSSVGSVSGGWTGYTNWNTGEPNNSGSGEDCGEIWSGGGWNDQGCSDSRGAICEGPAETVPTWDQSCVDLVESTCNVTCGDGSGTCVEWTPGMTDSSCSGIDLSVGTPCDGTIPICNHGQTEAPSGITISNIPTGSGKFATCNPDLTVLSDVQSCTTSDPIEPGQCISVTGCPGLSGTRDIVVNPTGATAECSCRDNWATYTEGTSCSSPLCLDISRGATGTPNKLDLYVLVSTEGGSYDAWWSSPYPLKSALTGFIQSANNDGVAVELDLINDPLGGCGHDDTCDAATCGTPNTPLGTLTADAAPTDGQEDALITAIDGITTSDWSQGWSLSTALQGVLDRARAHQLTAPNEAHAVVLLGSDVWGNACSTTLSMAESAATTAYNSYGIKTYFVDIADWSISNYDTLAVSGGTGSAFRGYDTADPSNNDKKQTPIRSALDSIVSSNATTGGTTTISCSYSLGSRPIDVAATQVSWTAGGTTTTLAPVADSSACGDGYYFDGQANSTEITLCPTTCNTIQNTVGARLDIQIPCAPLYTNRVMRQTYEANCPAGTTPQWSLLAYDATTPEDSSIDITAKAALTTTDLSSATAFNLATASSTSSTGAVCAMCGVGCGSSASCPVDLFAKLNELPNARLPVLQLTMTLNPSSASELTPTLNDWQVTYSCPPSE